MGRKAGVVAMALTDHDCLDGLPAFREAASGFEPIDGVEVSARLDNNDVHILGLFIDAEHDGLRGRLEGLAEMRRERARAMIARLRAANIPVTGDLVRKHAGRGTIGRPHLALALMELGAAPTMDEAFRLYLRPGTPGFVPRPGPSPEEVIEWVHEAGGVAVLAHPGLLRHTRWIEGFAKAGLDGLEIWHPKHNAAHRKNLLRIAERLDLVPSGGSDYHGASVGDSLVGKEPVPLEFVERLRERRPRRS
jgi:predicted metal-dependent phosphoesterase TrpH